MTALATVVYQMVGSPELQARVAQDPQQVLPAFGLNADEIKSVLRVLQSDLPPSPYRDELLHVLTQTLSLLPA